MNECLDCNYGLLVCLSSFRSGCTLSVVHGLIRSRCVPTPHGLCPWFVLYFVYTSGLSTLLANSGTQGHSGYMPAYHLLYADEA